MPINELAIQFKFRFFKNLWLSFLEFIAQVKGLFGTFGYIDLIDIVAVAIMLFLIIRILRETRAFQLVKGLIILAIIYGVVSFLGMSASSYIMRLIFANILIIVVILFGPEIRNILEQMGKKTPKGTFSNIFNSGVAVEAADMNRTIDAVVKACNEMSDDKIGALIVFENDTLLGDIIATGTIIDGKASKELIGNVFYPKSPLHDGAMIIRRDSVYAAGCILPLTKDNSSVKSSFGTRHRAAIGMSEESDALVFVVSEETGKISYAVNGILTSDISTGDMRDILTKKYIPDSSYADEKVISRMLRRFKK